MKRYLKSPLIGLAIAYTLYGVVAAADSATTQHDPSRFAISIFSRVRAPPRYTSASSAPPILCAPCPGA